MVKNIPAIERSTEIRFGKHVPDSTDQADNTIVFNASNVLVPTPYSNAVYLSPIRNRPDYTPPEVVLLMYDRNTKEITESGESANTLVGGVTFGLAVNRSNVTSNTVVFTGGGHDFNNVGFVTDSNVGLSNLLPQHTVSIGSNLYVDDTGSNVLVISGNVAVLRDMVIDGNLRVNGDTTVIYTENTSIKDAFIELGQNNTSGDTTLDLGVLMHRPDALSNVVIGYREETDEFAISYTDAQPTDKTFTPKTDEDINVHVYGLTHVDANIYAHEDVLVDGNVNIAQELTVTGNVYADKDLEVVGNVYVDGNVVAYKDLLVSGNVYADTNVNIAQELTVTGNVYVDGDIVTHKDLLVTGNVHVDKDVNISRELTAYGNVYAEKDLEVAGNVYMDGNVVAYKDLLVSGNVYVTGNVNITNQLNALDNVYVSGNVEVTKALIVSGNTHLEGDNVFVTHTMDFLDPTTAIVTDQVSNVQVRLGQLENVSNTASNPLINQVLTYDQDNSEWSNAYPDQTIVLVKNTSGVPMTRGQAVHVTGSNGNNMFRVELADASNASKMPAIGIVYEDLPINGEGAAVTFGRANGISGISEFTNGDTLYVSNTVPGGLTNVKPYGVDLDLIQNIGVVVNHSSGVVFVTGIGRANDIPNARIETSNASVNYVYVNSVNNDLRKIDPMKLPTKLQPLTDVVNTGNTAANAVTLRGLNITSGNGFHGDVTVSGNVIVDGDTLIVDSESHRVGLKTASPNSDLHIVGNAFVTSNITTTSNILVVGEASATSKTTGALQVTGGVGIQGDIHATHANLEDLEADSVTVTDTTAATSKTTGALQVVGGVGIQGDLYATDGIFTTNVYITNHTDLNNKHLAMIDTNGSLIQSPVYVAPSGKYVISASEAEFLGNITLGGNTTLLTSTSLVVEDRIIGIGSNNSAEGLDSGIIIEHQDEGAFANIALIHHADEHRFSIGYTQNTLSDNHILHASHPDDVILQIDLNGNTLVENSLSVYEMATFGTKVGIATTEPIANIHVVGNAFVTSNITTSSNVIVNGDAAATSKTTGALQVAGGIGVQGDIYGVTLYTDDYLTHIGDTNTKIGFPANDTFTVTTSGTERVRVDSSGDVGIGTANPSHLLELYGDNSGGILKIGNNTSYTRWNNGGHHIDVYNSSDNTGRLLYLNYYSQGGVRIDNNLGVNGYSGTDNLYVVGNARVTSDFEVGEVANLYVDTETSRVGINTDSPAYTLDVHGTSNVGALTVTSVSGNGSGLTSLNAGNITSGTLTRPINTSTGVFTHVSLGTDNYPTLGGNWLTIFSPTYDGAIGDNHPDPDGGILFANRSGSSRFPWGYYMGVVKDAASTNSTSLRFDIGKSSDLNSQDSTGGSDSLTPYLTIDNGNVGIGTVSPAGKLHVANSGVVYMAISDTSAGTDAKNWWTSVSGNQMTHYLSNDANSASQPYMKINRSGYNVSSVTFDHGNVGIGTTSPAYKLDVHGTSNVGALTATTGAFSGNVGVDADSNVYFNDTSANYGTSTAYDIFRVGRINYSPSSVINANGAVYVSAGDLSMKAQGLHWAIDEDDEPKGAEIYLEGGRSIAAGMTHGSIYFRTAGTTHEVGSDRMVIDGDTGNVGIGTTSPAYKLDVNGTSNVGALTATTVTVPGDGDFVMSGKPLKTTGGLHWDRVNSRLGVGTNSPATKLHVAGGTIINSDGVAKKTYSYSGELSLGQTIANSTIKITFSAHVFYAKIVAHLVESDNEVSTLSLECGGGNWSGGTPLAIAKGPQAIFGSTSTNPWDSDVTTTATTLSIKPTTNMAVAGHYNVFIEYISQHSSGVVSKITEGSIDVVTFGY